MEAQTTWQDHAACRGVPVDVFFPLVEQESDPAKQVCGDCTVQGICLEAAIARGETFGIWGGLTTLERRALVNRRKRQAAAARRNGRSGPPVV